MSELSKNYLDRFGGLGRLYGKEALPKLHAAHVMVIGIGGVGSWTAESLARNGVGKITLVDMDALCITNTNRQLPAIDGNIGREKASVMADRLKRINPECEVIADIDFFSDSTADRLLGQNPDCIVDAIDSVRHKCLLISQCRDRGIPLVVTGGAGGKVDPTCVASDDLAFATNDRLLKLVRKRLRQHYDFPPEPTKLPFNIVSVYSTENARYPWADGTVCEMPEPGSFAKMDCESGFGSASQVTGTFGFATAGEAVKIVIQN
ncbi:MAG: tRNA threonylcarbamoyladenosine dehydratase [Verrucomicrobiota bacterium]